MEYLNPKQSVPLFIHWLTRKMSGNVSGFRWGSRHTTRVWCVNSWRVTKMPVVPHPREVFWIGHCLTSPNQEGAINATVCSWHVRILLRIPVARILWDLIFFEGDWKVREETRIFWPLCCEVWKRSDAILGEKSPRRWNPCKTKFPTLSFYYKEQSTANSNSFKIAQKTAFKAKGRLYTTGKVIPRLFIIDLHTQLAIYGYRWGKR